MDTHEPVIRSGAIVPEKVGQWAGFAAGLFAATGHAVEAAPSPDLRLSLHVGPPVMAHCRAEGLVQDRDPRLELQSALYEGLLSVRDPQALIAALTAGIGSGKAFGFGLLSLAPAGGV